MVAKAAATVAILSNHRFILGVGVGWMKEECEQAGSTSTAAAGAPTR